MTLAYSADQSEIYYELEGSGEITLCWIYGAGGVIEHWTLQHFFRDRYKNLYIELAGHGKTKSKRRKYTMEAYAQDVAAVIEQEDLKKVILIGWSMGGPVILETAKLLEHRIIGLIGVDTFFPFEGSLYVKNTPEKTEEIVSSFRGETANKMWDLYLYHMNNGIKVIQELQDKFKQITRCPEHVFLSELQEVCTWDVLPHLQNNRVPLYAIMAGLSVPHDQRPSFEPYITTTYMEGHGHCLHWADADTFNSLLQEYITDIEQMQ
ncbi:MAG: alpha/beta hydrolase [Candidatus Heimdallarchaeota archaeon]|nr:alpha/beta hydrolase [Candidatus Heimdallarchaeota archaeon]